MGNAQAKKFYDDALEYIKEQKFDPAQECLLKSLELEASPEAYHNLASIKFMSGNTKHAIALYKSSARTNPNYHPAYINLTRVMFDTGQKINAVKYCALAIHTAPDERGYKEDFITIFRSLSFFNLVTLIFLNRDFDIKPVFLTCLKDDSLDHSPLITAWLLLLNLDPDFRTLYRPGRKKNFKAFKKALYGLSNRNIFSDPIFILGLKRFVVPSLAFEKFLTYLRRIFLEDTSFNKILIALADYSFHTGYIFSLDESEEKLVSVLEKNITTASKTTLDPVSIMLLGCYKPLYCYENVEKIRDALNDYPYFVETHITNPLEELKIRETIVPLTGIHEKTSQSVQAQYEEFPYPLWKGLSRNTYYAELFKERDMKTGHILVAGCGTGREALELALSLPDSKIVAIDLSLSSLSYAIRKAKKFGITNVAFKQGDILELEPLESTFDLITSSGVLHHMHDPLKGWSILTDKLKPGGYMHIALYSELARQDIVEARTAINRQNERFTSAEMRGYREICAQHLSVKHYKTITKRRDFYSIAECKDLIFHVQESRFTIHQIEQILNDLGLTFLKFIVSEEIISDYRKNFPKDKALQNLKNWGMYEKNNPDTFKTMYDFWCQKQV